MAKRVRLRSGREFKPITAAKAHFSGLREKMHINARLAEPERSDVLDIYRRYCKASGWAAEEAVDVVVTWDSRQQPAGPYSRTRAFAVVTAGGTTAAFSMDKALQAIAE